MAESFHTGGFSIFAPPAVASIHQGDSLSGMDYTSWWYNDHLASTTPVSTSTHLLSSPLTTGGFGENGATMLVSHLQDLYYSKCIAENLHLLCVSPLHPGTTTEQLLGLFAGVHAVKAEVVDPNAIAEPLCGFLAATRQTIGAVFFTRKDLALAALKKLHNTLPSGQNSPLVVRYGGPDRHPSSSPTASSSPVLQQQMTAAMEKRLRRDATPLSAQRTPSMRTTPAQHRDAAALSTAPQPPTAPREAAQQLIDQHFLRKYADTSYFLVGVHNLSPSTDAAGFFKMFYPLGASQAELYARDAATDGVKTRCSGVALFTSKGMAVEAAEKINDFVPHGQRRPLIARFLESPQGQAALRRHGRDELKDGASMEDEMGQTSASTPRGSLVKSNTAVSLLASIEQLLMGSSTGAVMEQQVAADMTSLVLLESSGKNEAEKLGLLITAALMSKGKYAASLSSPLMGALRLLHHSFHIEPRSSFMTASRATTKSAQRSAEQQAKAQLFLWHIGRDFMKLIVRAQAERQPCLVAAAQCAYLYRYSYLAGSPISFAMAVFRNMSKELAEARQSLSRDSGNVSSAEEEEQQQRRHRSALIPMDALVEMVNVWKSFDPILYQQDNDRVEYEAFVADFKAIDSSSRSCGRTGDPSNDVCTPRNETLDIHTDGNNSSTCAITNSSIKSKMVTPSPRPTPRPVVSYSSNSNSSWKLRLSTQPSTSNTASLPPQVLLGNPLRKQGAHGTADGAMDSRAGNQQQPPGPPPSISPLSRNSRATPLLSSVAAPSLAMSVDRADMGSTNSIDDCTVYVTKIPSSLSAGHLRELLQRFGEVSKVRVCYELKDAPLVTEVGVGSEAADHALPSNSSTATAHNLKYSKLYFCFVEFASSASAKAIIEFFRNDVHGSSPFHFLSRQRRGSGDRVEEQNIQLLRNTRCSRARNPIHDQQPLDATRTQPCLYGLVSPHTTIDLYADLVTPEAIAETLAQMQRSTTVVVASSPVAEAVEWGRKSSRAASCTTGDNTYRVFETNLFQPTLQLAASDLCCYTNDAVVDDSDTDNFPDLAPVLIEENDDDDDEEVMKGREVVQVLKILRLGN